MKKKNLFLKGASKFYLTLAPRVAVVVGLVCGAEPALLSGKKSEQMYTKMCKEVSKMCKKMCKEISKIDAKMCSEL